VELKRGIFWLPSGVVRGILGEASRGRRGVAGAGECIGLEGGRRGLMGMILQSRRLVVLMLVTFLFNSKLEASLARGDCELKSRRERSDEPDSLLVLLPLARLLASRSTASNRASKGLQKSASSAVPSYSFLSAPPPSSTSSASRYHRHSLFDSRSFLPRL